ncbi:MAG: GGDEF domain-containing protein [Deltaproteobacteria bacterium]|nr:GGDEF domain-containing protein [Deltaproteobacteria bacterium]
MLNFNTDQKTITEIAKKVLLEMGQKGVALTPENYEVWFEYCTGSNESLRTHINEIVTSGKTFTAEINKDLYDMFFGKGKEERIVTKIHLGIQKILKHILHEILGQSNSITHYSKKLNKYLCQLDSAKELSEIKQIVKDIIKDTTTMEESSRTLQQQLKKATAEAQDLKQNLEKSEREMLIDILTGVCNRKAFDKKINEFYDRFKKKNDFFSVIMLDIDLFKKLNDSYGHRIGDEVLAIVGARLKECVKGKDFIARYGGDEFVVLLPMTTLKQTTIVAENIRKDMIEKQLKLKKTGERIGNISVSLGVSQIHSSDTINSVIERADEALYLAKSAGGNNIKSENDLSGKKIQNL